MRKKDGWRPSFKWRVPPFGPRAYAIETGGHKYLVKPEVHGSSRYRLFIDGVRTEVFGVGPNYVLALAESEIRRRQHGKA